METTLDQLQQMALRFRDARNWGQFHSPKNLAAGLSIECSELQELFLWKTDEEVRTALDSGKREKVAEELADILFFLLYLSKACDVDLAEAFKRKLELNEQKYPVSLSYNSNRKYTELDGDAGEPGKA